MAITNHDRIGKASPKRAAEALAYNGLVQSWPEIARLARETSQAAPVQTDLL
jgi:putative DNA methylase